MRELFSVRNGYRPNKKIQLGSLDTRTINRLWNCFLTCCESGDYYYLETHFDELNYVLDGIGQEHITAPAKCQQAIEKIHDYWRYSWYSPLDVIEIFLSYFEDVSASSSQKEYTDAFNSVLEQEKSAYRFVKCKAIPITDGQEIESISLAQDSPYSSVNTHITKALEHYADRDNPDYENSIKESISAVEAMCCIITGLQGKTATLGNALGALEKSGVKIHGAMKGAFEKLYGYTSDENGIRHGGIDFVNAPAEDAKYMLIACSAFVNYLIEKHIKSGGAQTDRQTKI